MPFKPFSLADSIQAGQNIRLNALRERVALQDLSINQAKMDRENRLRSLAQSSRKPVYQNIPAGTPMDQGGGVTTYPTQDQRVQTGTEYDPQAHISELREMGETDLANELQTKFNQFSEDERNQAIAEMEMVAKEAIFADTPEKWEALNQRALQAEYIDQPIPWEQREMTINRVRSIENLLKEPRKDKPEDIITLAFGDKTKSFRKGDPEVDKLLKDGWVESKRPLVEVNMGDKAAAAGVTEASKKYGSSVGEAAAQRDTYAASASKQKRQLEQVLLNIAEGARTGFGEEFVLNLRSLGQTLGLPVGDLSKEELIRTVSNEMALRLRNPESGLGLTGNTSNRDLQFLKDSVVGLNRTEQGNIEIIRLLNKFNDLTIDVAAEQSKIIMKNGGVVPIDLNKQLMDYVDSYEFFTEDEKMAIESISKYGLAIGNEESGYIYQGGDPANADNWKKK